MVTPHYIYMVLKMLELSGIICLRGDVKQSNLCDQEACEIMEAQFAVAKLQEIKEDVV